MGECDNLKWPADDACKTGELLSSFIDQIFTQVKNQTILEQTIYYLQRVDDKLHFHLPKDIKPDYKVLIDIVKEEVRVATDDLVKKEDLGIKDENFDLKNLVKKEDLGVKKESVDLKELANEINKIKIETDKISGIKTETDKIKNLAKTADISNLAEKDDLKDLVKKGDLGGLTKKVEDVKAATDKISNLDHKVNEIKAETDKINGLAKTGDLEKLAKTDDLEKLAKIGDLEKLNQQVINFAQQDKAFDQAITKEIKTISQGVNVIPQEVKVEFVKGNEVAGRYETEIKLEGNKIGTFSPTGYYFFDNRVYIYDHLNSKISIDLSPQYHFLKVVKTEEDGYKLAFCNEGGQEYYNTPNDYKLISPENLKSTKNINFEKYYAENGSSPSFVVKMNSISYPNSSQHGVDVYKVGNGEKKIGSLIDEFGYYDSQNKFHYSNNHINAQDHSYNSPSFTIHRGDTECSLHKMQEGTDDIDLTSDAAACSLVEYVANYVNDVYI